MSLIQDALKRQQEEMNKPAAAPLGKLETPVVPPPPTIQSKIPLRMMGQPAPAESPPPPPPKPPEPPRVLTHRKTGAPETPVTPAPPENKPASAPPDPHTDKRNQTVLAVLLILLLGVGLGLYFAWPLLPAAPANPAPVHAAPDVPDITSVPPPDRIASPGSAPIETPENAATAKANPLPPTETETVAPAEPTEAEDAPGAPAPANDDLPAAPKPSPEPSETAAPPALPESTPPVVAAIPEPPPEPVVWPPIKLTGFVKLGATSAALINGKVVAPGETIEGVLLKSVSRDGAWVRLQGEERLLRVGETAR